MITKYDNQNYYNISEHEENEWIEPSQKKKKSTFLI
jgi:hypothetical protein